MFSTQPIPKHFNNILPRYARTRKLYIIPKYVFKKNYIFHRYLMILALSMHNSSHLFLS